MRWPTAYSRPESARNPRLPRRLLPTDQTYSSVMYSLYIYEPNKVAPIVFSVLYALSAGFHTWQC